ncbi:CDP-glucose 4,6-dehydratase [Mucilaginibacter yixingensis]|uniref:CDP-glucose 4,6-dehydratase n=1 Tax=Mucilaginibacter yixingensis TaxID=1295612 RepID=A0A2T5JGK4_9SPHI|nr:CDP-glucose 4,6-dehydratase [Mucilaginibacter yixingensis]PTR01573.1 CDP-glucose 4,6-dehydratase [Mucilaginibacter yixingensis]
MINELKRVYAGKKVFLTGHTGFKGAWLLKILHMLGAEIMGYALEPLQQPNLYEVLQGDSLCHSVIADLRDSAGLKAAVLNFQPDFIFHLAAQPLVRLSYQKPAETFEVNAIGTANLLDAVAQLNKRCDCVLITTDKVYHNYEWERPYHEEDRLGGYDPYSASKACAELVIDSYRNSFFNINTYQQHQKAIAVGRAGNVIGGGDWSKDRLIPDIVRALIGNERIEIRNPDAVRPWQHVMEPLGGYLLLGAKLNTHPQQFAQAYNFGPVVTDALPVSKMVEMAIQAWGSGEYFINQSPNQPHEAGLLKLDINRAAGQLSWLPQYNALEAVENTIQWYKQFYEHRQHIIKFTEQQIGQFLA